MSDRPRELEIGFGRGHFIRARAAANPGIDFVAIEHRKKWIDLVAKQLAKVGVTNVELIKGDAGALVRNCPDAAFDRVHIHFPDPWWKRYHLRRRLLGRHFVEVLARVVKPMGAVFVQTDVLDYASQVLLQFEGSGLFANARGPLAYTVWVDEIPERSHREARCSRDGTAFVQMKFVLSS